MVPVKEDNTTSARNRTFAHSPKLTWPCPAGYGGGWFPEVGGYGDGWPYAAVKNKGPHGKTKHVMGRQLTRNVGNKHASFARRWISTARVWRLIRLPALRWVRIRSVLPAHVCCLQSFVLGLARIPSTYYFTIRLIRARSVQGCYSRWP